MFTLGYGAHNQRSFIQKNQYFNNFINSKIVNNQAQEYDAGGSKLPNSENANINNSNNTHWSSNNSNNNRAEKKLFKQVKKRLVYDNDNSDASVIENDDDLTNNLSLNDKNNTLEANTVVNTNNPNEKKCEENTNLSKNNCNNPNNPNKLNSIEKDIEEGELNDSNGQNQLVLADKNPSNITSKQNNDSVCNSISNESSSNINNKNAINSSNLSNAINNNSNNNNIDDKSKNKILNNSGSECSKTSNEYSNINTINNNSNNNSRMLSNSMMSRNKSHSLNRTNNPNMPLGGNSFNNNTNTINNSNNNNKKHSNSVNIGYGNLNYQKNFNNPTSYPNLSNSYGNYSNMLNCVPNYPNISNVTNLHSMQQMNNLNSINQMNNYPSINNVNNSYGNLRNNAILPSSSASNISNSNNHYSGMNLNKSSSANLQEQKPKRIEIFLNNQPLKIDFTAETDKDFSWFNIYQLISPETFEKIFTRTDFLNENGFMFNLAAHLDDSCNDISTRKFFRSFTENNYFGLINLDHSYYIVFNAKNKIVHNTFPENIFPVFILNNQDKILKLEETEKNSKKIKPETTAAAAAALANNDKQQANAIQSNDRAQINEINKLKTEQEKLNNIINELKKILEKEKKMSTEHKNLYDHRMKSLREENESLKKKKGEELVEKAKENDQLKNKNKEYLEKIRSLESEKNRKQVCDQCMFNSKRSDALSPKASSIKENLYCDANKFNFAHRSRLDNTIKRIVIKEKEKVQFKHNVTLDDAQVHLFHTDEIFKNPSKKEEYERFLNQFKCKEEIFSETTSFTNINKLHSSTKSNIEDGLIEEIEMTSHDDNNQEMRKRITELSSKLDNYQCVICLNKERNCLFEDCGHLITCYDCICNEIKRINGKCPKDNRLKFKFRYRCPVCKMENKNFMKILIS